MENFEKNLLKQLLFIVGVIYTKTEKLVFENTKIQLIYWMKGNNLLVNAVIGIDI